MTKRLKITFLICLALLGVSCKNNATEEAEVIEVVPEIPPIGFFEEDFLKEEGTIRNGENFTGLMMKLGLSQKEAYDLSQICGDTFDVRKMRSGNRWSAYYDTLYVADSTTGQTQKKLNYVVYENDKVRSTVFRCIDSLSIWTYDKPIDIERKFADVTIKSSLWNDMLDAGASPLLILTLSDIYAWTVDFFGLQKEDRFQVMYSQKVCEGEILSVDTVYYAVFSRGEDELPAIMFDQKDGGNLYWNEKGESMRKAFLKAPLKFNRISSGFSYARRHPITGRVRPHTGVDYAAPKGTPVMSIGDGTVIAAGYGVCGNAGGHAVKIRHNSVYTTAYLHLSKYGAGIKSGTRVRQGQIIGYVGSTGSSTGPHLDFRVWRNGSPINPLKMESPPSEPLKAEFKAAFDSVHLALKAEMNLALMKVRKDTTEIQIKQE